jgi:hypothetical protein
MPIAAPTATSASLSNREWDIGNIRRRLTAGASLQRGLFRPFGDWFNGLRRRPRGPTYSAVDRVAAPPGRQDRVHTRLLSEGPVDEIHLDAALFFVGEADAPRFVHPAAMPYGPADRMRLVEVRHIGDVVLLRYVPKRHTEAS